MMASTHVAFGLTCWAGYARLRGWPIQPEAMLLAGIGSLLPDIDSPKSSFGKVVPFFSYPISLIFGHRGITHSLFAVLGGILAMWFYGYQLWFVAPLAIGYLSHLAGDMFTNSGVPLMWPSKEKYSLPIFNTGGFVEFFVRIGITGLLVWIVAPSVFSLWKPL